MGFTQVTFLFAFMPLCILIYLAAYRLFGKDLRICNVILLCEGLLFYWWAEPRLLVLFIAMTILMSRLGGMINDAGTHREKKRLMILSVMLLALIPVLFKYLPALRILPDQERLGSLPFFSGILLPVGISFFILGAISYIVDIYTGETSPGSLIEASVFMLLFPKAVCGPVVLWRDFSPQLQNRKSNLNDIGEGLKRIIVGYAKKAVIADTFAAQIMLINSKVSSGATDTLSVWLLALLYFFRIYYDFSGYSDIAIGLMKVFGFSIGDNFNFPYLARSLSEFWRRWHISLGRWFREYIYIPLGGNRRGNLYFNILITFLTAGLWHGWRLPVLLWALMNALIVMAEKAVNQKGWYQKIPGCVRITMTILIVCLGWILFSSTDMTAAGIIFKSLFVTAGGNAPNFTWRFFMTKRIMAFLIIAAAGAFGAFRNLSELLKRKMSDNAYFIIEKTVLLALLAVSIMFVMGTAYVPFIYSTF